MADTPRLDGTTAVGDINDASDLLSALEAAAGLEESAAARAEATIDMIARGKDPPEPPASEENDEQMAMALLLKRYIKGLIRAGAFGTDADANIVF
jgi:hypothetical protein